LQALNYHLDAIADFDYGLIVEPQDCNLYFGRAISKEAIGDYNGALSDIDKAIEFSKLENITNQQYNERLIPKFSYEPHRSLYVSEKNFFRARCQFR
jgi:tetratricopeptide (TPR) repeat protein